MKRILFLEMQNAPIKDKTFKCLFSLEKNRECYHENTPQKGIRPKWFKRKLLTNLQRSDDSNLLAS